MNKNLNLPGCSAFSAVNNNQPDKDVEIPDEESLTTEEYEKAIQDLKDRSLLIEVCKKVRCGMFTLVVIDGAPSKFAVG